MQQLPSALGDPHYWLLLLGSANSPEHFNHELPALVWLLFWPVIIATRIWPKANKRRSFIYQIFNPFATIFSFFNFFLHFYWPTLKQLWHHTPVGGLFPRNHMSFVEPPTYPLLAKFSQHTGLSHFHSVIVFFPFSLYLLGFGARYECLDNVNEVIAASHLRWGSKKYLTLFTSTPEKFSWPWFYIFLQNSIFFCHSQIKMYVPNPVLQSAGSWTLETLGGMLGKKVKWLASLWPFKAGDGSWGHTHTIPKDEMQIKVLKEKKAGEEYKEGKKKSLLGGTQMEL